MSLFDGNVPMREPSSSRSTKQPETLTLYYLAKRTQHTISELEQMRKKRINELVIIAQEEDFYREIQESRRNA